MILEHAPVFSSRGFCNRAALRLFSRRRRSVFLNLHRGTRHQDVIDDLLNGLPRARHGIVVER